MATVNKGASTFTIGKRRILLSYDTVVAYKSTEDKVAYVTDEFHSKTTTKHINTWLALEKVDKVEAVQQNKLDSLLG